MNAIQTKLFTAVHTLSVQSGVELAELVTWLCDKGGLAEMTLSHFVNEPKLQRLRAALDLNADADLHAITYAVRELVKASKAPVDVVLHCPACKAQHIDVAGYPDWKNPPHHTHKCHSCGELWTASTHPTNGVLAFKPGKSATWPRADASLFAPARLPARDDYGFTWHPDLPAIDEDSLVNPFLWAMGYECRFVSMDGDSTPEVFEKYCEGDSCCCLDWTPTTPEAGYLLAAIYDTEDGPYALFVRPIAHLVATPQPFQGDSTDYHGSGLPL